MPEDAQWAAAVQPGRFFQFGGDGQEELPQQKHAERAGPGGHDQRPVGVEPVQAADEQISRDQQHLTRDQHGGDQNREKPVPPRPVQARIRIGGQRVHRHHQKRHGQGDKEAVAGPAPDRELFGIRQHLMEIDRA